MWHLGGNRADPVDTPQCQDTDRKPKQRQAAAVTQWIPLYCKQKLMSGHP